MKITVCVPAFRAHTLVSTIESVQRQTWMDWELILVTQGLNWEAQKYCEEAAKSDFRIRHIHIDVCGCTRARNVGIRTAAGDVIAFLDDDCEADPKWLSTIAECFDADPEVVMLAGSIVKPKNRRRGISRCPAFDAPEAKYDPGTDKTPPDNWGLMGANMALRMSVIEKVGLFDEFLGPGTDFPAGEDTDYALRIEALQLKMQCTPRAIVCHTYGTRYGIKSLLSHSRNYAMGNGGVAGKQTIAGDPRGREWLAYMIKDCFTLRKLPLLPIGLLRLRNFIQAYKKCERDYAYNRACGVLVPRREIESGGTPSAASGVREVVTSRR